MGVTGEETNDHEWEDEANYLIKPLDVSCRPGDLAHRD